MTAKPIFERNDFIILLGGLSALTALSIDITLPATGVIARDLNVKENLGGLIVGVYFLAFAVGQIFWGLLSDAYGRRKVLLISLSLFTLASIGCALSQDFWMLIGFRLAQGLAGGAPVIARAIARDVGDTTIAAKILAVLMAVTAIAPMLAPIIGSGLFILFSWRAIFVFLAGMGIVLFILYYFIGQETASKSRPERFSFGFLIYSIKFLFTKRDFIIGGAISGMAFGGYASILSLGAVVTEQAYDLEPTAFAAIFAIGALFILGGSLFVRSFVGRFGLDTIIIVAVSALSLATFAHCILSFLSPSLPVFWSAVCIYMFAYGLILPAGQAFAMGPAGEMSGFASSVLGAILMLSGALGAVFASAIFDGSHNAITLTMTIFGALAVGVYLIARITEKKEVK